MFRLISWSALWLAIGCGAAQPRPTAEPLANLTTADRAPSIEGVYREPHVIQVRCDGGDDGWCDESVEDRMTIRNADAGSIAVTIELVQTNAHSCTFDGRLRPAPARIPGEPRWTFEGHDETGACSLAVEQRESTIEISSDGCRYYCGVRASLDAVFAFPPMPTT